MKDYQKDLSKDQLYESVKCLLESDYKHIHLSQQKLYTLFSIAFQYLLFQASRTPGHYIIRVEDSFLADKLARKAKDESTRKFLSRMLIPRKLKFEQSMLHLDFFNLSSWSMTNEIAKDKIKAALIVKNTSHKPMIDETDYRSLQTSADLNEVQKQEEHLFGEHFYLESLLDFLPKTITIAFEQDFPFPLEKIQFPFIEESVELVKGVKISSDVKLDS